MTGLLFLVAGLLQVAPPNAPAMDMARMANFDGGVLQMGTPTDLNVGRYGDGWYVNELPEHRVEVSAFAMDRFEVTVGEYALFLTHACGEVCFDGRMPITRSHDGFTAHEGYSDTPVVWVDHRSAGWYCRWAGKRLPTEAQWEFAAAGTDKRAWPWSSDYGPRCTYSPYSFDGGRCGYAPQRTEDPQGETPDGVHGLGGNVAEWVGDWYASYDAAPSSDPVGPSDGTQRVVRGGSFLTHRLQLRPQSRRGMTPSARAVDIGFRCAWSPAFEDLPGVVRGDLVPASPPTEPRPVATHEKLYQTVLTGLDLPGVVRSHSGYLYIAEKSAVTVLDAEGEATRIDDLEIAQWIADASRVYGIDRTSNTLWGFDGATHAEVFTVPDLKTAISHGEEWIWTDGTAINRLDADGGSTVVVNGRNGVNALAADGNTLVWTEAGTDGPILARIDLSAPEMTETLVGPDQIPNPLRLWGVRLVNAGEALLFVGMEGWPYSGLLCRYASNGGRLTCLGHSPPKPRDVIPTDAGYLWATQFGVFRLAAGQVERVGDPMSPGGFTTGEDKIWVTDRARGLLLELTR